MFLTSQTAYMSSYVCKKNNPRLSPQVCRVSTSPTTVLCNSWTVRCPCSRPGVSSALIGDGRPDWGRSPGSKQPNGATHTTKKEDMKTVGIDMKTSAVLLPEVLAVCRKRLTTSCMTLALHTCIYIYIYILSY